MQLFTIGLHELAMDGTPRLDAAGSPIETYDNDDVTNPARVFTGYRIDISGPTFNAVVSGQPVPVHTYTRRAMTFDPARHSTLEARFLGATIPADTPGPQALQVALDALFRHANVGPFIGRQLTQRLVTSHPSPGYVARVAPMLDLTGPEEEGFSRAERRSLSVRGQFG